MRAVESSILDPDFRVAEPALRFRLIQEPVSCSNLHQSSARYTYIPRSRLAHDADRGAQDHHRAVLRPRDRLPPRNPLLRAIQGLLPAARRRHLRVSARAQLDRLPLREPRRLRRKHRKWSTRPRPLLHGIYGCYGDRLTSCLSTLGSNRHPGDDYVYYRRTSDLRDYYLVRHVLPGGAGILN